MCVTGPCSRCDDAVEGLLMLQNFVPTKRMLGLGEDARVKIVLEVNEERLATCTFLRSVADEFAARVGETGALEHAICAVEWLLTCMTGPQTVRWDYIRSIVSQDTFVALRRSECELAICFWFERRGRAARRHGIKRRQEVEHAQSLRKRIKRGDYFLPANV